MFEEKYKAAVDTASQFDGMMQPLSIALFEGFLQFQAEQNITGDMIEFGVYRGKSASVIMGHLNEGEEVFLVDVAD